MAAGVDQTQTATGASGNTGAPPAMPPRIGRYTVERVVGVGGMGVVYAAFDPDLERRVAVKVLRVLGAGVDQRARLLREARAMAKLAHRNVITVHEVGTDGDVDFIAMELIDGDNLAVWLRERGPRSRSEVLRVFRDAGQALAAAHDAGVVHRDFKPHNVLVGRDGRVVVTDFGLARGVDAPVERASRAVTSDPARSGATLGGGGLGTEGLTRTGALVGTPAYMPPEQFDGGSGEPSADQFSFCVAVWEGLTGARPFSGESVDELHRAVLSGLPSAAGRSLPRRLRGVLARGLDADPRRRWPSMPSLLTALAQIEARPRRIAIAALAALVIAGIGAAVAWPRAIAPTCGVPASAIEDVWSSDRRAALPADVAAVVTPAFDRARRDWETVRTAACAGVGEPAHPMRAACLRDAAASLDALVTAAGQAGGAEVRAADVAGLVPEPGVCLADTPPSVPRPLDAAALAAVRVAVAALLIDVRGEALLDVEARSAPLTTPGAASGCAGRVEAAVGEAQAIADGVSQLLGTPAAPALAARARSRAEAAAIEAGRCGHDAAEATALVVAVEQTGEGRQPSGDAAALLSRARAAVERAGRPVSLMARLEVMDAGVATDHSRFDEALRLLDGAQDRLTAVGRHVDAVQVSLEAVRVLVLRSGPGDLDAADARARTAVAHLREALGGGHRRVTTALRWLAQVQWYRGADAEFAALRAEVRSAPRRRSPPDPASRVRYSGRVVDGEGSPVAGATVAASPMVVADASFLSVFDFARGGAFEGNEVTTDADGVYQLDGPPGSMIVAEHDGRRSRPAVAAIDRTLRLEPSGQIRGAVTFASPRRGLMSVGAMTLASPLGPGFVQIAPVRADGTFTLARVPPGHYDVWLQRGDTRGARLTGREVDVMPGRPTDGVDLRWQEGQSTLDVLLRADRGELDAVQVTVVHSQIEATTWAELSEAIDGSDDTRVVGVDRSDGDATARGRELQVDLVARVEGLEAGAYTVCATPLTAALVRATSYRELNAHADRIEVTCVPVEVAATGDHRVTLDVAPMRRLPP
jgi:predicted Ser/Thr protein kinase